MKKIIATFVILFFTILVTICPIQTAVAAPLSIDRDISILHLDKNKTVTMGKEVFEYKTFSNDNNSKAISVVEITQPPQYEGLLLRKHVIQSPEDIYVLNGDFEFVYSQSDKKTKATAGDIVSIPSGVPFGFTNIGTGEGKVLVVSESEALPKMLSKLGTSGGNKNVAPDFKKISSIAKKYGIDFLN